MKKSRFSDSQIMAPLKQAEAEIIQEFFWLGCLHNHLLLGIMALFLDGDGHINEVEALQVAMMLRPFVDKVSEGRFLRRCQKRL